VDWIEPGALTDLLLDDRLMALDGDELLRQYVREQPEAIVSEEAARFNALHGHNLRESTGSVVYDPWSFVNG